VKRLQGLDAIRMVCAAWVVFFHFPLLPPVPLHHGPFPPEIARVYNVVSRAAFAVVEGQSAVIIFFLISGLCIHFPYRDGATPEVGRFYARRGTRILIPLLAACALSRLVGFGISDFADIILWSLIAEVFYYAAYPILLGIRRRVGWAWLLVGAYIVAYAIVATVNPRGGNFQSFGHGLNWLVGLPCWLLGCVLAESLGSSAEPPTGGEIWGWRIAVWAASVVALRLRFNVGIGMPWTLPIFAILVFGWLRREIPNLAYHPAPAYLERAGVGSYTLYLVHGPTPALVLSMMQRTTAPPSLNLVLYPSIAALWYVFYRLVEAPSHRLSQRIFPRQIEPSSRDDAFQAVRDS
jgi:peptidoglycan/LPS O-acetylase OafA/YrhL